MPTSVRITRRAKWLIILVALTTALSTLGSVALASDTPYPDPGLDGQYDTGDFAERQTPDVTGDDVDRDGDGVLDTYRIETSVEVGTATGGGGDSANIQCIWNLVDINRPFLGDSQQDQGFAGEQPGWNTVEPDDGTVGQLLFYVMNYAWYDFLLDDYWYDDVHESIAGGVPDPIFPCIGQPGNPSAGAEYFNNALNTIQVYANAADSAGPGLDGVYDTSDDVNNNHSGDITDPNYSWPGNPIGERVIELWAAVDGPGNNVSEISQVFWDVWHPDGTKKIQVHDYDGYGQAECADGINNRLGAGTVDPFDPSTFTIFDANTVMGAALGTAQVDEAAVHAIMDQCAQNRKKLYFDHFTLSKHQPCGPYQVNVTSVAASGAEEHLTNYISVLCFIHLDLDFESLTYPGPLQPTDSTIVDGDTVFFPGDGRPTAVNVGSGGLTPVVDFYSLVNEANKKITHFDLQFGVNPFGGLETATDPVDGTTIIKTDTIGNPTRANLPETANSTLCANETGKFVFSIHTQATSSGVYTGPIDISARPVDTVCNNDLAIWGGYHRFGPDGVPEGGGPGQEPVDRPAFDDDYGRNQRAVVNP